MDERFGKRIAKIRDALGPARIEGLWVEPSLDLTYLTGLQPISMERIMGLLVRPSGNLRMVVPEMLAEESEVPGCELFTWNDSQGSDEATRGALTDVAVLHVSPNLPIGVARELQGARPGLSLEIDASILASARAVKDEFEMEALRRASRVTDGTVEWVASLDPTGLTERELARRISQHYAEAGHRPWDELLVASGSNAAMPHYHGGDLTIDRSRPLLIDIGAAVGGYQSDTTRVLFPEVVESEVEDAYRAVLDGYHAALATVTPGVPAQEVDRAARRAITDTGYGERFIHRTGHGVGLDIHEHPYIREGNAEPLQVGNCFSIEPGIYVPGRFGLRYENLVLLTSDGPEPLNRTPERLSLS